MSAYDKVPRGAAEAAGVDLVLLQFSPQLEEMERFGRSVIVGYPDARFGSDRPAG